MFHSLDIQVFVFLIIPWFTKSVMLWWGLVHETGGIFEYKFWSTTHWATKLGQSKELNKAIIFRNLLNNLEDWDKFQVLFNLETCSIYSITNYVTIPGFHIYIYIFFEKVNKTFKNCKYQLLKMARFRHIVILIKSKKDSELVSSLQYWPKNMLEMLVIQDISI